MTADDIRQAAIRNAAHTRASIDRARIVKRDKTARDVAGLKAQAVAHLNEAKTVRNLEWVPDFFPTPAPLVQRMIEEAFRRVEWADRPAGVLNGQRWLEGLRVLEPSAGKGDIAVAAQKAGARVWCVESVPALCDILSAKGFAPTRKDFLGIEWIAHGEGELFDVVLMNPPFSHCQDARHIMHAWQFLGSGGVLVAICSEHPFHATAKTCCDFRSWLRDIGATVEKLPAGTFAASLRPTNVNTRIIIAQKQS